MAQCVTLNPDGTLSPTADAVEVCAGYVMVSGSEYGVFALVQTAFAPPTPEVIATVSSAAFFAPLFFYLVALMVGKVAGVNK